VCIIVAYKRNTAIFATSVARLCFPSESLRPALVRGGLPYNSANRPNSIGNATLPKSSYRLTKDRSTT
jgi:hypothetical protein